MNHYNCSGMSDANLRCYIKSITNDEIFWHDILNKVDINNNIDRRLDSQLANRIRNELDRILPEKLQTKYNEYIINQFPAQIRKEVEQQIPAYLLSNHQMQHIIETHRESLRQSLESTTRQILARITNEAPYQEIMAAHLENIDRNGAAAIAEITLTANQQATTVRADFDRSLRLMSAETDRKMADLTSGLDEVQNLRKQINILGDKLAANRADAEATQSYLWGTIATMISVAIITTMWAVTK